MKKREKIIMAVSGALTAAICAVMNFVFIPRIESVTQGIRCFDMNFGYDYETAQRFISLLTPEIKQFYLNYQLALDFFYPVAYCLFFVLVFRALTEKSLPFSLLAIALAAFDYGENICILLMLKSDSLSNTLVSVASAFTMIKTVLLYLVILLIIILLIRRIINKKRGNV